MKAHQAKAQYNPIVITLEKRSEAQDFFSIIDKIEDHRCNDAVCLNLNTSETELIIELSNLYTSQKIMT